MTSWKEFYAPERIPAMLSDFLGFLRNVSIKRLAALAALGFGPMVLGHLSAFVLAAPDPNARRVLLESTGHGSFHLVMVLSLTMTVFGIWRLVRHSLLRARDGYQFAARPSARPVVLIQGALYIGLECLERAVSGGLWSLLVEPAFQIGSVFRY